MSPQHIDRRNSQGAVNLARQRWNRLCAINWTFVAQQLSWQYLRRSTVSLITLSVHLLLRGQCAWCSASRQSSATANLSKTIQRATQFCYSRKSKSFLGLHFIQLPFINVCFWKLCFLVIMLYISFCLCVSLLPVFWRIKVFINNI